MQGQKWKRICFRSNKTCLSTYWMRSRNTKRKFGSLLWRNWSAKARVSRNSNSWSGFLPTPISSERSGHNLSIGLSSWGNQFRWLKYKNQKTSRRESILRAWIQKMIRRANSLQRKVRLSWRVKTTPDLKLTKSKRNNSQKKRSMKSHLLTFLKKKLFLKMTNLYKMSK